jgi:signal transduction histidine kinase
MMEAMSDIVWSINTRNDRFDNITTRMLEFATGMLEPLDCSVHLSVHENVGHVKLDMQQRKNIYLIFKEAINNAAKYSGCKNVWVDIGMQGNKKLIMTIKDDGSGFALQPKGKTGIIRTASGNGLANMRNRAEELKGSLFVDTAPGRGTTLRLECMIG